MLSLKELQDAFMQQVMTGDTSLNEHVVGTKNVPAETRIAIYEDAYRERLIEVLENDYEMLNKILGEEAFRRLSLNYIDQYPSSFYSLRWFGSHLPEFLGYSENEGNHDWEAELAKLEWEFIGAFDASDSLIINENDIASIPGESWPELSIEFHSSVRLFSMWWNTLDLWQAAKDDRQPPQPVRLNQNSYCLLWRNNLVTQFRSLESDEVAALSAALAGAKFPDICGALAEEVEEPEQIPMTAAGFLKGWLAAGLLTGLKV
jgi:hypothetical protein